MKKPEFIIRRATIKDKDALVEFRYKLDKFEHAHNSTHPDVTKAEVKKSVEQYLKDKLYFFFVAEVDGKVVGFSAASIKIHERTKKKRGTFEAIWVEPKYRRHGVGRELSKIRLDKLRQYKLEKINVYIRPKNTASIDNVKKLGAKHTLNVYSFSTQ